MKAILFSLSLLLLAGRLIAQSGQPDKDSLLLYFQQQQFQQAARYLEPFSRSMPGDHRTKALLGYAYYKGGQLTRAATCFRQLYQADSTNLTACQYLGTIHMEQGDKASALPLFCRLTELKPGVVAYEKQLASLWEAMGNLAAGCYYYQLAYADGGQDDPEIVSGLASGLITQKLFTRADSMLDASLAGDSAQGSILKARIWSAYLEKDYPKIFPMTDKLAEMGDFSLMPFLYAAIAHYQARQYQACIDICEVLIAHNLITRYVLYLQALAYKGQKRYTLSLLTLDACIGLAIDREAEDYFSTKGEIYELLNSDHEALREYDTAYYLFHNPLQLYNKAQIYDSDLKSFHTALRYYRLYRKGREDTITPAEAAARKFTSMRIRQLAAWEAQVKTAHRP